MKPQRAIPVSYTHLRTHQLLNSDGQGIQLVIRQKYQRSDKVIPAVHKGKDRHRRQRRFRQRDNNPVKNSKFACPVYLGGFRDIIRYPDQKLPQQKDKEGITKERRNDQRKKGSDPAQLLQHQE